MKIAIDSSPIKNTSGHKVRGSGFYTEHLIDSLKKYVSQNEYVFFEKTKDIPKDVDVVHYPYFEPFFLSLPFRSAYPTVVTAHDLTPLVMPKFFQSGIKGKLKWLLQKKALKNKQAIITDSIASKKDIITFTGISKELIHVVYLAAGEQFVCKKYSEEQKKNIREKLHVPEKFLLYVGDVTANKNLPRLLDAVETVKAPLVMVGKALINEEFDKTNPWNKDLLEVGYRIKNMQQIVLKGFVSQEELVDLYNVATVSILPSLYEGFGLPVLEAMQCGCPVVTTTAGSLSEVAGEDAYIVDPKSSESIANGIRDVFNNEKLQKELSKKGLLRAKEFTWQKTAGNTASVYKLFKNT